MCSYLWPDGMQGCVSGSDHGLGRAACSAHHHGLQRKAGAGLVGWQGSYSQVSQRRALKRARLTRRGSKPKRSTGSRGAAKLILLE